MLDVFPDLFVGDASGLDSEGLGGCRAVAANFVGHRGREMSALVASGTQRTGMWILFSDGYTGERGSVGTDLDECV